MSESKHTPGPWYVDGVYINSAAGLICEIPTSFDDDPLAEPDARLIAAAPDLLEAAQKVIDEAARMAMTTRRRKIFDNLAAVIAKAEGR